MPPAAAMVVLNVLNVCRVIQMVAGGARGKVF